MGDLEQERQQQQPAATPQVTPLQANPGRVTLEDLDPDEALESESVDAGDDDGITLPDTPQTDTRKKDRETIAAAEAKLVATIENEKIAPAQRKTALRDLLCTQRGIDYAKLPAGDATKTTIDNEVEQRFAAIVKRQQDAARRAKLDKTIDNTKLSREARLEAFYQEFLLDRNAKDSPDQRAEFDKTGAQRFELRDEVTKDNAKQRAIVANRKSPAKTRLDAYQALFRNQYAIAMGTRFAAMKPEKQAEIDQKFQVEVVPQFQKAEADAKRRAANEARAKALEPQLRPTTTLKRYQWGTFKMVTVPDKEDVYREILVLRSGLRASDPRIQKKVSVYRQAVAEQNAASRKALSATEYFNQGFLHYKQVTKADIQKLWPNAAVEGRPLADAMFPDDGQILIAPSQQMPILIRAGAILYGGEKDEVVARMVERGTARIEDLRRPIVLITPEVMDHYLSKVLLPAARQLMKVDDQVALMEAVLVAYKHDKADGSYDSSTPTYDAQMKLATGAVGWKPVTQEGAPIDLGDKNSQGATVSWTQAVRMNKPIEEAQLAVDEQQKKVDEILEFEKQETERRQKAELERLRNNPYLLNKVGVGPPFHDPRRAEAEAELQKRKGLLERRKQVQGSFTQQAMDLKFGNTTFDKVNLDLDTKLKATDAQILQYTNQLAQARIDRDRQIDAQKIEQQYGGGDLGSTGARGGMAIVTADANRKVTEIEAYIGELRQQREELAGYITEGQGGALPAPIRITEMQDKLDKGYRFVPTAERWGRAIVAGAEEAGAFVMRVFAGLVDVSIPGIIEHGGNEVLALLGSDARLNLGIGWATSNIRDGATFLEGNAQYQMAQTGGGLDVEIIKGLTTAAILYLPTMGFGSVGAAVGGAIRATQMARLLGQSASLATMGLLATMDKGPGDKARAAIPMAALPIVGAAFKSVGGKLIASFFSNMTSDILVAADYNSAINVMRKGGNLEDAIAAAAKSVNFQRALAQGFIGVMQEAHGIASQQKSTALAEEGMPIVVRESGDGSTPHEYYKYTVDGEAGAWTKVEPQAALAQAAKNNRPPVRVTEAELGVINKGGEQAMQALTLAEQRSKQVDSWGQVAEAKQKELATIDVKSDQRAKVSGELERAQANEDMLRLAEKGAELDAALVEKAGQAPAGYVRDAKSGKWRFTAEVQQKQIDVKTAEITAIDKARASYERNLAELYTLRQQLKKGKSPALEAKITEVSAKVKAAQETYLAVGGDPSIVKEVAQAEAALAKAEQKPVEAKPSVEQKPEPVLPVKQELPTQPIPEDAKPWVEAEDGRKIFKRADETFVDQNGRVTDSDGTLVDAKGNWIDQYGRRVDGAGRLTDADGNLINEKGQRIDKTGKLVTEGEKAALSERDAITKLFTEKFGEKTIAYRGIRIPKGSKVLGTYKGGSDHGQMVVFDYESALHYAKNPAYDPPAGMAAADEIVIIQFEIRADQITHDPYGTMEHVFVGKDTDITTMPGYKETRMGVNEVAATSGGATPTKPKDVMTGQFGQKLSGQSSLELAPPDQRPPGMDDEIVAGIARRGEEWANNIMNGTCASAAMKNTISAQIAGFESYVMEFQGSTEAARILDKFGLADSKLSRVLEKMGVDMVSAHAIAAIKVSDGTWRYISWGRVEGNWEVFAKEAFGDSAYLRGQGSDGKIGEWTTGDHVKWMVAHKWDYPAPTRGSMIKKALVGWMFSVGK